jgi:hypothetical protein
MLSPSLNPKRSMAPFYGIWMAKICLNGSKSNFSFNDFLGSLLGYSCTTFNLHITLGSLPLSIRSNFAIETDDHVVHFESFDFIYQNSI